MQKLIFVAVISLFVVACSERPDPFDKHPETGRWYSKSQVMEGRQIYRQNCQSCHGIKGVGAPKWNIRDAQGFYPPPPLDGSAHSWHHPYAMLHRTISEGSRGRMPAWKGTLKEEEIDAVIAYFQSLWPQQAYELWLKRHRK